MDNAKTYIHVNLLLDRDDRFLGFQQEAFKDEGSAKVEGDKSLEEIAPVIKEKLGVKIRTIKVELKDE